MTGKRGIINPVPDRLRGFARTQRSQQTTAEGLFWTQVRAGRLKGLKFKRQVPIGPFVADFLCSQARVIVELDGPPHDTAERREADALRDAWLRDQGFAVLRFSNDAVLGGCDLVLDVVVSAIEARRPLSRSAPPTTLSR